MDKAKDDTHRRNSIFSDGIESVCMTKNAVYYSLRRHIQSNLVLAQVGSKELLYKQINGIPQGSTVSTVLCNLYYGDIEKRLINPDIERYEAGKPHFFVRLVDDFLYITTAQTALERFVGRMHEGFPEYGMHVNSTKTQVSQPKDIWIKWCGLRFHTTMLWVRMDHSRLDNLRAVYKTFNADFSSRAVGEGLVKYLYNTIAQRGDPILFDATINSESNAVYNLAQLFVFTTLRLHYSTTKMQFVNHRFLATALDSVFRYTFPLLEARTGHRLIFNAKKLTAVGVAVAKIAFKRYTKLRPILGLLQAKSDATYAKKYSRTIKAAAKELFL